MGLLREADGGVLFLDEIAELGLDEQAMLLKAIEEKRSSRLAQIKRFTVISSLSPERTAICASG
jgi:sigma54-dependent transcription regulator